jgi:hypothetical protein
VNWISDLLRQVTLSKTLTFAVFAASATLLFGPRLFPGTVETVPKDWQFVPVAALVLSACFLLVWFTTAVWRLTSRLYWFGVHTWRSRTVEGQELELLCSIAKHPDSPINLRAIDYDNSPYTRFEYTHLAASLARKGLVSFGPHERAIVILTQRGERIALRAIQAKQRAA